MFANLFRRSLDARGREVRSWAQTHLGYSPKDIALLQQALRHSSAVMKEDRRQMSNERLEFLGDAVLGAVAADLVFQKYHEKGEGFLTRMRSKLVSRQQLNSLARKLKLDAVIEMNMPPDRSSAVYGNALEAVIGAMYLEKGYTKTCSSIERAMLKHIDLNELALQGRDDKSQLLEWGQKQRITIEFITSEITPIGKDERTFQAEVQLNGERKGRGKGRSKKKAEQQAAAEALKLIPGNGDEQ